MDFTGKYKIVELQDADVTDAGIKFLWVTPEAYLEKHAGDREAANIIKSLLSINEDGTFCSLFPIPEGTPDEEIDKAIEQGAKIIDRKYLVMDEAENSLWEMRGEDFYTKTGVDGEFLGEKTDPWIKSNQEDGTIIIGDLVKIRYKKAE